MQEQDLDQLLAQAAARPPAASPALMDRVLADALAVQDYAAVPVRQSRHKTRPAAGLVARLAAAFGGPPLLAGVCSAALAGVAIGYLEPNAAAMLTGAGVESGAEMSELFPAFDFLTTEG